jgi:1D-myo-inositol-tetrakisphosphate 5-kinase/inositol-polyphosphate multikinase
VMTSEDGSLLIKPALPLELAFYQSLTSDSAFQALRPFVPKFYGILKLEGQVTADQSSIQPLETREPKESLVLENLSHPFSKPNILDIKLGTVLYDESASPEKVERMIATAKNTTSLESGVRLTGFQVYDNTTGKAVNTPKSYGKSIKVSELAEGIAKFFPSTSTEGLPIPVLLPILREILADVKDIREAYSELELRMIGGSLLIIYEGDIEKAKEGVKKIEEGDPEEDQEDEDDEDDEEKGTGLPFVVKLIDFAHTRHVVGQGPDECVLIGMDTAIRLLEGRIKEIEAQEGK